MQTDLSRIALRPFRLSDADDVLSFGGDDQVTRVLRGFKTLTTKDEALNFIENVCFPHPWRRSIFIDDRSIGVVRLQSFVAVENKASQRILEKVVFQREGVLRKYLYLKGDIKDMVVYSFLSSDFTNDLSSNELSRDESRP
ncbi:hypothetical protein ACFX1X_010656 [Malus domestica]